MRTITLSVLALLFVLSSTNTFAQKDKKKGKKGEVESIFKTKMDTLSYIIGSDIGANLKKSMIDISPEPLVKGMQDAAKGADTLFSEALKQKYVMDFQNEMSQKMQAQQKKDAEANKAKGVAYLEANKKDQSVKVTASGLQYKVIKAGSGASPKATDEVEVNYEGKLIDGKVFDSSYERGKPVSFPLNQVIPGWTEGVQLMNIGSIYEFVIPAELAYGEQGNNGIPGNSTLIFKVELLSIKAAEPAGAPMPEPGTKQ